MSLTVTKNTKMSISRILTLCFFVLIVFLMHRNLSEINWQDFKSALYKMSPGILLPCFSIVILNFLVLTCFDFLGFRHLKVTFMTYPRVMWSAFCSYVFNLNIGALVGGVGMRFRIYTGWGVEASTVPKIILFSSLTNLAGHTLLLASIFVFSTNEIARLIPIPPLGIKFYGYLTASLVIAYLILCYKEYVLRIKEMEYPFPKLSVAFLQLMLSFSQWSLISLIIFLLIRHLGGNVTFNEILLTTLVASVAGVFAHIPAGLGVIEAIFLQMNFDISNAKLLAALLCYRALYYLIPLLIAIPAYVSLEAYQKKVSGKV